MADKIKNPAPKGWSRGPGFKQQLEKYGRLQKVKHPTHEIFTKTYLNVKVTMPKPDKRQPTLYDILLSNPAHGFYGVPEIDRNLFRLAERYVFDKKASRLLSHLITETAPLIMREYQFARPPHPVMWIEEDFDAHALADPTMAPRQDATADELVGYFIHGNRAYMASYTKAGGYGFVPYWFELHKPISIEEELQRAQDYNTSRLMWLVTVMGDIGFDRSWWGTPEAKDFARNFTIGMSRTIDQASGSRKLAAIESGAGSIKHLIAMLLMLTRPGKHVIQLGSEPLAHTLIKGKRAALAPHRRVTIHLSHDKAVKRILNSMPSGKKHRHHRVRGGWAQTRRGMPANCLHEWEWADPKHATCSKCGARRWWRKNHTRGDIHLGRVSHDYDVTE